MIRLFILIGIVGVGLLGYLSTEGQGPDYQGAPSASLLDGFQADGIVPVTAEITKNEKVGEGIFNLPPQDEVELEKAKSAPMPGMNMPMGTENKSTMKMEGDTAKKMPMGTDGQTTMKMAGDADKKTPMKMPMKMDGEMAEGGLKVSPEGAFDREISLTMQEWKFSNMKIDVKRGEKIRFTVTNGGKIPHEFMFMTMPAMAAINYRARRADWNLLEHEATYEQSLVLPGGKFSFVAEIQKNGVWMFMCMLPYHMQMGMMGQMATPGMAMDMKM